ncbi:CHAD domain containing protein [Kribbella sp. ALI-6-A]|uniref:CYTH and CHAD domain-containing protein n=1 Tax=Kribbella sp. ALI-6-A TaxID=1933817 RepID=UPI00097C7356|nr:CYTH and CHAD domain-containing protein [Kribbella sp. ALI-6-A]ONI67263.1 CHAD domain containing protein [Kribbella sp. ALI-6-A]
MTPTEQLEIETKYDVDEHAIVPALHELPGVDRVEQPVELALEAVYFDTADLRLAANKVTLRRRTGGEDDGWHIKLPAARGRLEIQHPLGRAVRNVPIQVLRAVRVHVRDHDLVPVVTLATRRIVHRLLDAEGEVLAEVSDDHVTATVDGEQPATWREWEIELVNGGSELLEAAEPVLREAGATPASGPSKLARALGDRVPRRETWELPSKPTTADLFRAYATEQVQAIHLRDPEVRRDLPDALHKMRVATRRLRSALATYRPVVDREVGDQIRDELKWFAGELGGARDAEVLREHFLVAVSEQPSELVMGRVAGYIDDHLRAVYKEARTQALEALESERYFRLLDTLDGLVAAPPLLDAETKAKKQVPELLKHDLKRMRRCVKRAENAATLAEQDHELHETRKAAKRLRYAAESAVPLLGERAAELVERAKHVQEILGDHQDSVVARDLLRRLAVQQHLDGGNPFTLGRLHAAEQYRGDRSREEFLKLWPTIDFS